jgi:hypothetical protein
VTGWGVRDPEGRLLPVASGDKYGARRLACTRMGADWSTLEGEGFRVVRVERARRASR